MDQKTALVTGATGFTGWHMVKLLEEKGYQVIATDIREPIGDRHHFQKFIKVDLTKEDSVNSPDFLKALYSANYIFHIAGLFNYASPAHRLFEVNVSGTRNLLRAIGRLTYHRQNRVVVWGAAGVFGNFDHIPLPATEDMPPKTDNSYLLSKLEQERVALTEGSLRGIPITVIRPSAVYGPHSNYGMAVSIITMLKTKVGFIIGNGKNKGALVHVQDVVRAAEFLARNEKSVDEVYHVTDDALYSVEEVTRHLTRSCGALLLPFKMPRWLALKMSGLIKIDRELINLVTINSWLSNEKIKTLGFEFQYPDSKIGLTETVEWYKANPSPL